ncbi:metallophosphoesterase [Lacticigenium naphthae]|uniref:metallophosphoesterase n=1 Tax=Lacticigenium naphthae TaxID=515351 RepID=UPI00040E7D85|nr:metallophosphoesterase [Lacticigenium naphthae]
MTAIGIISDLHIDRNQKALKKGETYDRLLSQIILEKQVEFLLIAGDVSNQYEMTQDFLEKVQKLSGIPIYFVPGNHDYWVMKESSKSTRMIHQFYSQQQESLIGNPRILNDEWALVGNPGWYDYGFADDEKFSEKDFQKKQYKFASWNDRHHVDWEQNDRKVSSDMLIQLKKDLHSVKDKKIILMTHVATHSEFVMPLPHRLYDYANAFLGAKEYEGLYTEFRSIQYSIMGHVHFRKTFRDKGVTYIAACLGLQRHWELKDAKKQIENTLVVISL